eukprot:CAMPEP_0179335368 /NCGR_PEP_ID=MMETSP0797-20121207/66466_1 /TAXON_ID=47934 /ORGANISM="Dinophysis acuminata, Strain DAEP01" /LENGTH=101 /DNA_ID=CAMNT_0021048771 /DNA_START=48 /DNA_END=353 /DNA_ORIENTATION=+
MAVCGTAPMASQSLRACTAAMWPNTYGSVMKLLKKSMVCTDVNSPVPFSAECSTTAASSPTPTTTRAFASMPGCTGTSTLAMALLRVVAPTFATASHGRVL